MIAEKVIKEKNVDNDVHSRLYKDPFYTKRQKSIMEEPEECSK